MSTEIVGAGWPAGASATGAEKLWGEDANGAAAELPLRQLWTPQVSNFNPAYGTLQNTRRALARVRSGLGPRMNINFVGHSAVLGIGGGAQVSGVYCQGAQPYSQSVALAKALRARNIPARNSSFWGLGGLTIAQMVAMDTRITLPTGFLTGSGEGGSSFGGGMITEPSSAAAGSFTPTEAWDTGVLYSATSAGLGSWGLAAPGVANVTQATPSTTSLSPVSITAASAAVQTFQFGRSNGGAVFMVGLECYQAAVADVNVRNFGWNGARIGAFIDTTYPYSTLSALTAIGGDLTIIECLRNDQLNGIATAAQWQAQMQTFITGALGFGDVILVRDHAPGVNSYPNDAAYNASVHALGEANNIPVFDIPARLGTAAQASGLGLFCGDGVHYTGIGWHDIGYWIGNMLASL